MLPEFGKHAFVIWASYGGAAVITASLIAYTLIKRKDR